MNIVLISTCDISADRSEAIDRMLASVEHATSRRPDLSVTLLLLLQKCPADLTLSRSFPAFVEASSIPNQVSLSAARNSLLSRALADGVIGSATIVGFPDDDCWYPQGTLEYIADQFTRAPELDLWFCRYSSDPLPAGGTDMASRPASVHQVIREASSNTMFVRGWIIRSGILFDEELGVGTSNGGGEDTEFALHAHVLSTHTMHLDAAAVGHRDKSPRLRARYYRGGLVAIARHAQKRRGIAAELARKIAVGGWLTLRGELSLPEFFDALSAAFNAWRTARSKLSPSRQRKAPT